MLCEDQSCREACHAGLPGPRSPERGGSVPVTSEEGHGSVFVVKFPEHQTFTYHIYYICT